MKKFSYEKFRLESNMLFILFKAIGKIFEYNIEYKMKINWPYT